MGRIARIISSKVDDNDNIICTVESSYGHNIQAPLFLPAGDDSFPLPDDRTILVEIEGTGNYIACGILTTNIDSTKGEKLFYSRNSSGVTQSKIHLTDDGKIVFNDGTDFAVRYNELKTQLDQLITDFDDLVTKYNTLVGFFNGHTHAGVTAGGASTSAVVGAASTDSSTTADFSNCKVDNINLEGVGE